MAKNNILDLAKKFKSWESAQKYQMWLSHLSEGKAQALVPIKANMLTPHPGAPVLLGMVAAELANNTGVFAVMTLLDEKDAPILPAPPKGTFNISFVPEEEVIQVLTEVVNDRKWLDDKKRTCRQIILKAEIVNLYLETKAKFRFIYKIIPLEKMRENNKKIAAKYRGELS